MNIITAKFIYINGEYKRDYAIAFDKKILDIGPIKEIINRYPNFNIDKYEENSIIYPGFINPHVHLEFSANKAALNTGSFMPWLYSVIEHRDELMHKLNIDIMEFATKEMLKSGVTTFGEISSFGASLKACINTPQRVIYFNEAIGSNPAIIDALFSDFKQRLLESQNFENERFIPAIAIHSPYSVHPFMIREVLKIAKEQNLRVTAHFLESKAEREWLENSSGEFLEFFMKYFKTNKAVNTIESFLNSFKGFKTLFTHCTQANENEIKDIEANNNYIIHCPRSNNLLNCGRLKIENINKLLLGTDGLSSNYSLSILDELKAALMLHSNIEPKELSLKLIKTISSNASDALNLNIGKIQKNYYADFAIFNLPNDLNYEDDGSLALFTITHCNKATAVYISGVKVI